MEKFIENDDKELLTNSKTDSSNNMTDKLEINIKKYIHYYYDHKIVFLISICIIAYISFNISRLHFNLSEDNRNIVWKKGLQYTKKCLEGKLIQEIPNFPDDHIPILSIIIPVYNANKTIKSAVRSIQNQRMKDYEILLVNDCSNDNSLEVIHELQKEDPRIKIMSNAKNMGALYSRSVGALKARGHYIFALDNDDMFFVDYLFEMIYSFAVVDDYDIIGFKSIVATQYNPSYHQMKDCGFHKHPHNLIVHQPDLGVFPLSLHHAFKRHDVTIWAKCIKTSVYKAAVNRMGEERYSKFMSWAEDTSIIWVIFNTAKSYKFVGKYGIMHIEAPFCASFTQPSDKKTFGEIFLTDTVYEFTKNNSDKNYAAYQVLDSTKRQFYSVEHNKNNSEYLKRVLKKILESEYITSKNKNDVRIKYSKFKFYKDQNDE